MGREIVRQESQGNPGQRSRLWNYDEAFDVLIEDMVSCFDSFSPFFSHESRNHIFFIPFNVEENSKFSMWFLFKI